MRAILGGYITKSTGEPHVSVSFFNDNTTYQEGQVIPLTVSDIQTDGLYSASIDAIIAYAADREWVMTSADIDMGIPASVSGEAFPVGSVFVSVVSTNPSTLLGYGTWSAFGAGRTLVGLDAGQTEFDTVEETGGAKTHTLQTSEIPSHTHVQDAHTHVQNAHNHTQRYHSATSGGLSGPVTAPDTSSNTITNYALTTADATAVNQNATAVNQNTGGGGAHNNLSPYIVVYFFKRTS